MKDLIDYLLKSIVKKPQEVVVREIPGEGLTTLEIKADKEDYGQIIGKKGRIIKALQTLVQIRGIKEGKRYFLKLLDLKEGVNSSLS
jgi:predicted RNA-binding protein YlqC (UPF0109 family)